LRKQRCCSSASACTCPETVVKVSVGVNPVRTRTKMTFADQSLEARHPHHEKFIEIGVDALEQGDAFVLRLLEDAPIELKP